LSTLSEVHNNHKPRFHCRTGRSSRTQFNVTT